MEVKRGEKLILIIIFSVVILVSEVLLKEIKKEQGIYVNKYIKGVSEKSLNFNLGYEIITQIRKTLAAICWIKAEIYFHGGISHADELEEHTKEKFSKGKSHKKEHSFVEMQKKHFEKNIENPEESFKHYHHHHHVRKPTWFHPYVPRPEHGIENAAQMMPWYWLTTFFDPHFTRAYANGAYFLAFILDKKNEALQYLEEGLKNNPTANNILIMFGWIYFKDKKYKRALYYLQKVNEKKFKTKEDAQFFYSLMAATYEKLGEYDKALLYWQKDYEITKRKTIYKKKILPLKQKIEKMKSETK